METLKEIESLIYCQICTQNIEEDTLMCTQCSCMWCAKCITRWLEIKPEKTCPNCTQELDQATLIRCSLARNVNDILMTLMRKEKEREGDRCPTHNKYLDYFCNDCEDLACSDCIVIEKKHNEHNVNSTNAVCTVLRSKLNAKVDRVTRACADFINSPEDFEHVVQKLTEAISQLRADTETKIERYKEQFRQKFGTMEEYRQKVISAVKEVQDLKDCVRKNIEKASDIKLIKEQHIISQEVDGLSKQVEAIKNIEPIKIEELEGPEKHMPFESHEFTIPAETLVSEEYELYDTEFAVSVTDDLIGLFKSFNISVGKSKYAPIEFEYDICLIKENQNLRAKEHEDKGFVKQKEDRTSCVKSAFHVEESQFRDNEFVCVQLSIRPKTYAEFCKYQAAKITALEQKIADLEIEKSVREEMKEEIKGCEETSHNSEIPEEEVKEQLAIEFHPERQSLLRDVNHTEESEFEEEEHEPAFYRLEGELKNIEVFRINDFDELPMVKYEINVCPLRLIACHLENIGHDIENIPDFHSSQPSNISIYPSLEHPEVTIDYIKEVSLYTETLENQEVNYFTLDLRKPAETVMVISATDSESQSVIGRIGLPTHMFMQECRHGDKVATYLPLFNEREMSIFPKIQEFHELEEFHEHHPCVRLDLKVTKVERA